jgi:thiol-disulfide isomerase/thioredoxin
MRIFLLVNFLFLFSLTTREQGRGENFVVYRAVIHRPDRIDIPFTILAKTQNGNQVWVIKNSDERITLKKMSRAGDSLFTEFPVFESRLHLGPLRDGEYKGYWFKGSPEGFNTQAFSVYPGQHFRFKPDAGKHLPRIAGRWAVSFIRPDGTQRPAIAEFKQDGSLLTGTVLTPSGDYRYLEGIVSGDSLEFSTFDGSHAFYFRARVDNDQKISGGLYYSGTFHKESWSAVKNQEAKLPVDNPEKELSGGKQRLDFSFPGLDGRRISIRDKRFRNKVVIIQLMGSWCSNCMDETAFLSEFYSKNKTRGIEMVALAYEFSPDTARSRKSLRKFQNRFHIEYPVLITGVTAGDSLRTRKTLPQLEKIDNFPTTIFLDKSGVVRKIDAGFNGPATGEHYAEQKKMFYSTVDNLLSE